MSLIYKQINYYKIYEKNDWIFKKNFMKIYWYSYDDDKLTTLQFILTDHRRYIVQYSTQIAHTRPL